MSELTMARLSAREQTWVAEKIDAQLHMRSGERRTERGMRRALAEMNVYLAERMLGEGQDALFLAAHETATVLPVVLLSARLRGSERTRVLAHEAAHAMMRDWVANALYDVDQVIVTDDDCPAVRHHIARLVEANWE